MYLVGQEKNKKLIDEGRLDNASFILIKGPKHYGKTYMAKYIANHYEMSYVLLDNKVDTIRQLVEVSNRNNNCIYHFKDFDKSSPAAKAALLKIAEETPKGVKIIVTTAAYNFLDTLVSRAYVLDISPYSEEEIKEYGINLNAGDGLVNRLYEANMNLTPTLLFNLKDNENVQEVLDLCDKTIECINNGLKLEDISDISAKFWKDDKDKVALYLDIMSRATTRLKVKPFRVIQLVEQTQFLLGKVAINNFRNLIHNMLMEMV